MSTETPATEQCVMADCDCPEATQGLCERHKALAEAETEAETEGERESETTATGDRPSPNGKAALADAVEWFHGRLDEEIAEHTEDGEHPQRATTAREWFEDVRGFASETVREKSLGWAPPYCTDQLTAHLHRQGHDREDILASGVFTERESGTLSVNFSGRYVFPYFGEDGQPAYAIARCTGSKGGADYDGHPGDFQAGKYAKLSHTKEYVAVDEPIFGLGSLDRDGPVLITEGVADAIRAHEAGYACLSPVTTQFKNKHLGPLLQHLGDGRPVYVVQDSEPAPIDYTEDADGWDALAIEQFGAGLKGGIRTAAMLRDEGIDAYVAEIPRMAEEKVDLDDYLGEWADTLAPVLAGANPAEEHRAYDDATGGDTQAGGRNNTAQRRRETADTGPAPTTPTVDRDLSRGNVIEALSHVSKSLHYDDWVQLAYAVHDWDDSVHGKAVFERWARQSPKWRDESQGVIDWVWANATPGVEIENSESRRNPTTIATLLHRASKDSDYTPPEAAEQREPVAPIPVGLLDKLSDDGRERALQSHGVDIPDTDDLRADLRDAVFRELRTGSQTVLDAPTGLGKSYTVASEPWRRRESVTGGRPVIHLHQTTDARDEAAAISRETDGVDCAVLKGRDEISPLARGDHDPVPDPESDDAPEQIVTIDGQPASDWIDTMCNDRGLPFSTALAIAQDRNDQGLDDLPPAGEEDPAVAQWDGLPTDDEGHPTHDVIHATNMFAYVPSLVLNTNVVLDEQPDYTTELDQDRIRRAVTAYLSEIDAPAPTWEALVSLAQHDGGGGDAARIRDAMGNTIGDDPPTEWFVNDPDAHALAPDIAAAVWGALRWSDPDDNGRRSETVSHEPPRFDTETGDGDGDADGLYIRERLTVVVDVENTVRSVRVSPDFGRARSVVGLDAHPCLPLWSLNVTPELNTDRVPGDRTERRLWRRYERGLTVVQIGDTARPRSGPAAREWMNDDRLSAVLSRLDEHYGDALRTGVTTTQVKRPLRRLFEAETGRRPELMHYGNEKSRNEFEGETAGFVHGCMDPGDEMVLDALAALGLEARPETVETDDGETKRAVGRGFDGTDADTARELLASVRENHVAQAVGRYARHPDDPDSRAVVYVDTNAVPESLVDYEVSGVEWLATDLQREIIDTLAGQPQASTRDIADAVGCSKEHVRQTLDRLAEHDIVTRHRGQGDYGADVFEADTAADATQSESDAATSGAIVNLGTPVAATPSETTNDDITSLVMWSLAIFDRHGADGPGTITPTSRATPEPATGAGVGPPGGTE